jgi:hypothetical protein
MAQSLSESNSEQLKSFYEMLLITFSNDKGKFDELKEKFLFFV